MIGVDKYGQTSHTIAYLDEAILKRVRAWIGAREDESLTGLAFPMGHPAWKVHEFGPVSFNGAHFTFTGPSFGRDNEKALIGPELGIEYGVLDGRIKIARVVDYCSSTHAISSRGIMTEKAALESLPILWVKPDHPEMYVFDAFMRPVDPGLIGLDDVILPDTIKNRVVQSTVGFLNDKSRSFCSKYKIPFKRGIIFAGDPGSGKTYIAKALANLARRAKIRFMLVDGGHMRRSYYDLAGMYATARHFQPCIVYLEDVDGFFVSRDSESGMKNPLLSEALSIMDGLEPLEGVVSIWTTNYPEHIDKAILRPGRIDQLIEFPSPDAKALQTLWARVTEQPLPEAVANQMAANRVSFAEAKEIYRLLAFRYLEKGTIPWDQSEEITTGLLTAMGEFLEHRPTKEERIKKAQARWGAPQASVLPSIPRNP